MRGKRRGLGNEREQGWRTELGGLQSQQDWGGSLEGNLKGEKDPRNAPERPERNLKPLES